jgi:hypothetical protein
MKKEEEKRRGKRKRKKAVVAINGNDIALEVKENSTWQLSNFIQYVFTERFDAYR